MMRATRFGPLCGEYRPFFTVLPLDLQGVGGSGIFLGSLFYRRRFLIGRVVGVFAGGLEASMVDKSIFGF
jgi:hypothetical protein